MAISDEIRKIMDTLCINQKELAKMIQMSPDSICKYLANTRDPSRAAIRKLVRFANENGVPVTYQDFFKDMDDTIHEQTTKTG